MSVCPYVCLCMRDIHIKNSTVSQLKILRVDREGDWGPQEYSFNFHLAYHCSVSPAASVYASTSRPLGRGVLWVVMLVLVDSAALRAEAVVALECHSDILAFSSNLFITLVIG